MNNVTEMARQLSGRDLVVAIDGPSASGKSTAGRLLAHCLGYLYINSGAMYRAAAWRLRQLGVPVEEAEAAARAVEAMEILYLPSAEGGDGRILVDGTDVSDHIGTAEIGSLASAVSAIPTVRRRLVAIQQQTGAKGRVVMDGRDIGSVVFPEADVKFYLDAGLPIRAERRRLELEERGEMLLQAEVEQQLASRDHADANRTESPLLRTADSNLVDSGEKGPEEVVDYMIRKMHRLIC